ncbi:hypothetical protein N658DRAFT_326858 [Parathielavia hyrcaniae]|uniref:Uncharacterized protein n=1 Tax=Parathielavia hyrcaniae TaxID=113614 RepID=A0AAN6Q8G5_9PEZI|nr:hypothetical protein N658DRAFT_326858 [Parathielavia hyrcaniae]
MDSLAGGPGIHVRAPSYPRFPLPSCPPPFPLRRAQLVHGCAASLPSHQRILPTPPSSPFSRDPTRSFRPPSHSLLHSWRLFSAPAIFEFLSRTTLSRRLIEARWPGLPLRHQDTGRFLVGLGDLRNCDSRDLIWRDEPQPARFRFIEGSNHFNTAPLNHIVCFTTFA